MCLAMRLLFLILLHFEIGFTADAWCYASDVLADAFFGTIQNPRQYVFRCFTD
jgi:hypothetical protein